MNAIVFAALIGVLVFTVAIVLYFLVKTTVKSRRPLAIERKIKRKNEIVSQTKDTVRSSAPSAHGEKAEVKGRFFAFGVVVAGILGTLMVKLWTLQILSSDTYADLATQNMTTTATTPAPRGRILDRNGVELVGNRASRVVVAPKDVADDRNVVHRLSLVLGIPKSSIRARLLDDTGGAQADRVVAYDVSVRAVSFIAEHPTAFSGVSIDSRTVRTYPYGSLAAHMLGYTGTISQEQLEAEVEGISYESGDIVGKSGAEAAFEKVLQGVRGSKTLKVDANGNATAVLGEIDPHTGSDVRLTLDVELQKVTDETIVEVLASARSKGYPNANAGALVCMDVTDGSILASSSYPTFNPAEFIGGISNELWESLNEKESGYPLTNRVIAGMYPAASTFKAFTGMAGLEEGVIDASSTANCTGTWTGFGSDWPKKCWNLSGHGYLALEEAIEVSCDIYFYEVARKFYEIREEKPDALQGQLRAWGFGATTGIDISGEAAGRVPDAAWKAEYYEDTPESATWLPGDISNMIIGQGDLLVTPLQIATSYAGIAHEQLMVPHLLHQVMGDDGEPVITHEAEPYAVQPQFTESHMTSIKNGLLRVITHSGRFSQLPVTVSGKSGTGETGSTERDDYSWYVAYAPAEDPKYCVACLIEQGGGGSTSAIQGVLGTLAKIYDTDIGGIDVTEGTGD